MGTRGITAHHGVSHYGGRRSHSHRRGGRRARDRRRAFPEARTPVPPGEESEVRTGDFEPQQRGDSRGYLLRRRFAESTALRRGKPSPVRDLRPSQRPPPADYEDHHRDAAIGRKRTPAASRARRGERRHAPHDDRRGGQRSRAADRHRRRTLLSRHRHHQRARAHGFLLQQRRRIRGRRCRHIARLWRWNAVPTTT
jgi:hypothetical protein